MNLDRLISDGTVEGTQVIPEQRAVAGEELWWPPTSGSAGVVVTERSALQLPAFLAAVTVLATDVAVLPLDTHQRMPDGNRRDAWEHGNVEILKRSPDGETTPFQFKQALMSHAAEFGNGYAEIQRLGNGRPYALHLLAPETTRAKRIDGRLGYTFYGGQWLEAANVLHIAGLSYDGVTGYNLVKLTKQAIGLGIAAANSAGDYFENGSEPGGYIKVPYRLKDQEAVDRVRGGWEGRHAGLGRKHRVGLLEEGAEWVETSGDPAKSQLVETRKFQVIEAIRALRVSPHKVGDLSEAHLANIEASNLDYVMNALMGWLTCIEQQCNLKLFSRSEFRQGYYCEHDVTALLRGDVMSRYRAYEIGVRNGWFSRDEIRRKENMNPIGKDRGGDLYTIQAQVVPLDQAGVAFAGKAGAILPTDPTAETEPATDAAD